MSIHVFNAMNQSVPHKTFNFSGGEVQVAIKDFAKLGNPMTILAHLRSSNDIMELLLVTDALRRLEVRHINLYMPYIPYARQDRVMNPGESLALKVFADIINSQLYDEIVVSDAHSDVAVALFDNCNNLPQHLIFNSLKPIIKGKTIVAPDSGALKKIYKFAKEMGVTSIIRGDKLRNVQTGEITGTKIYMEDCADPSEVFIVDDICDGGRTFIELATVLKGSKVGKISLIITHGIFSKGLTPLFDSGIDFIYVANMWLTDYDRTKVSVISTGLQNEANRSSDSR